MISNTFCPLPWIHFSTKPSGDLRVCCWATRGPNNGILKDEHGNILNINNTNLLEVSNAPLLKDIRSSMIKGERHPECIRCWDEEDSDFKSHRLLELEKWGHDNSLKENTLPDGTVNENVKIIYFDLRFGNLCNLKCRMCGPSESSSWYDDFEKLNGIKFDSTGYDWPNNKSFWDYLEDHIPYIEQIYLLGGEPTLIKAHYKFLQKCIDMGYADRISLDYNSNITNIHNKCFDLWKHFKHVQLSCSIDGIEKVNDYIRYPSKWSSIYNNLKKLEDSNQPNLTIWIILSVSILNIFYLDEIIKWQLSQNFKNINKTNSNHPLFSSHPVYVPAYLSFKVLPKDVKEAVATKLRSVYGWAEDFLNDHVDKDNIMSYIIREMEGHINIMFSEDHSHLLDTFWNVNDKLDEIRSQSIDNFLPEFSKLLRASSLKVKPAAHNGLSVCSSHTSPTI